MPYCPVQYYTLFLPGAGMGPDGVVQAVSKTILQRSGQPEELAPAYVLLASSDGSYITGSLLDINGENARRLFYRGIQLRSAG